MGVHEVQKTETGSGQIILYEAKEVNIGIKSPIPKNHSRTASSPGAWVRTKSSRFRDHDISLSGKGKSTLETSVGNKLVSVNVSTPNGKLFSPPEVPRRFNILSTSELRSTQSPLCNKRPKTLTGDKRALSELKHEKDKCNQTIEDEKTKSKNLSLKTQSAVDIPNENKENRNIDQSRTRVVKQAPRRGRIGLSSKKRLFESTSSSSPTPDASLKTKKTPDVKSSSLNPQFSISPSQYDSANTGLFDIGLFNCEHDVGYTGNIFGEGTDGKVEECVLRRQRVALKRAKPHDGFSKEEAKRRSAIELHYLRRVRHQPGFIQCLGMCDGIEHTCIALEVMDFKLSDYQRQTIGSKKPFREDEAIEIISQICVAMIHLHEDINIAHGDLAFRNILIRKPRKETDTLELKLADFGRIRLPSKEPKIFEDTFSFYKNADVGCFGRDILYRLFVGDLIPTQYVEQRSLHKYLTDSVVLGIPDEAEKKIGKYLDLFYKCVSWGVRPSFREILENLDDLKHFSGKDNNLFPLKSITSKEDSTIFFSPHVEMSKSMTTNKNGNAISSIQGNKTPRALDQNVSQPAKSVLLRSISLPTGKSEYASDNSKSKREWKKRLSTNKFNTPTGNRRTVVKTPVSTEVRQLNRPGGTSKRSLKILKEISKLRDMKRV